MTKKRRNFVIVGGVIAVLLNSLSAIVSFRSAEYTEFGIYVFIAVLTITLIIVFSSDGPLEIHKLLLLALISTAVALFYLNFPDLFEDLAIIFGVSSFIYLLLEKIAYGLAGTNSQ